jgi:exopolysaccharide production protein ExoZ
LQVTRDNKNQLVLIQYLRAIAALMVVVHHAREPQSWLFNPLDTYPAFAWGVDIFFVISGFIMFVAASNEMPLEFVKKRLIRVIPLYWVSTILLLLILTKFHPFSLDSAEFTHLIKSFLFIPHYSPSHPGKIYPYLIAGWTLNYEMFFYGLFLIGLIFKKTAFVSSVFIVTLTLLGLLVTSDNALFRAYTNPILLEFLGGLWIGYFYKNNLMRFNLHFLLIVGFMGLFFLPFLQLGDYLTLGRISFSLMIIVGAVSLSRSTFHYPFLNLLGDASYSIYLTHSVVSIRIAHKLWSSVDVTGMLQFIIWVLLTIIISTVIGVIVYLVIEKPTLNWLRTKVVPKKEF